MTRKIRWLMCGAGMCLIFVSGACGGSLRSKFTWEDRKEVRKIKEWADAVELLEKDNLKIYNFHLDEDKVTVWYTMKDYHMVLENMEEFIESSDQFLAGNSEYFGTDDFEITVRCVGGEPTDDIVLSNRFIDDYFDIGGVELDIEDTYKLQYLYIAIRNGFYMDMDNDQVKIDVPVLLLNRVWSEIWDQEEFDLSFLDYFVNLEYIIINIQGDETYDYTVLKERIEEQVPDCKVYIMDNGEPLVKEEENK